MYDILKTRNKEMQAYAKELGFQLLFLGEDVILIEKSNDLKKQIQNARKTYNLVLVKVFFHLPVEVKLPVTPRVVEVALLKKAVVEEATLAKKLVVVASVNKPLVKVPRAEKKL